MNIMLQQTTSLVQALCYLYNWLIAINEDTGIIIPESIVRDRCIIIMNGGITNSQYYNTDSTMDVRDMLDRDNHFDNTSTRSCHQAKIRLFTDHDYNPREALLHKLNMLEIEQTPKPMGTTTTTTN